MDQNIRPSLQTLWDQLHACLLRFIRSRVADDDDAEDILQDVFLRIHERLDTVRDMDRLESWIYQIARNSIIDYYRSRRRIVPLNELAEQRSGDEEQYSEAAASSIGLPALDAAAPEAFDEDITQDLARDIREIVFDATTLTEPYREALILTEYQGLTQKEMAERLGISLSGAKSRVQRARQKVKDALMTCCHFEFDARGLVYDYRPHCCCCEGEKSGAC